jgi:Fic family protein
MRTLGFPLQAEATLKTLTEEVVKTSEIEGENLNRDQVRSSIARRLGMDAAGLVPADRNVEGIVEVMLDATRQASAELTKDRLFGWHSALFPTGRSGMHRITAGGWRTDRNGPMQVVSGAIGKEKLHFVAPPAERVDHEMTQFFAWFNERSDEDPVLRSALAHLWLVTIHPFEDGNGRIARAVADMALARFEGPQRFYSMSSQIRQERNSYYDVLEKTQKASLDITPWLTWYLDSFKRAIARASITLSGTLRKARLWEQHSSETLNERQRKMINRLFDGFEGKLTTSKWAAMNKCSQDTAYRDILDLIDRGILRRSTAAGRSASYSLSETPT